MAAAEARVVWQQTANRYFIQEDAKRAIKIASISSVLSKIELKPVNPADSNDSFLLPYEESFHLNHSSDSKWWVQLQPDYMYQRGLTCEQVNPLDSQNQFVENPDDGSLSSLSSKESYQFVQMDMAEKNVLHEPMHSGLEPQKIKCGLKDISRRESQADTSKTKILEALCHSQTRARKAEIAAKKAYAEKEHAIKVVFRQASQLFAYRQWIYLLQLENLCYRNKNKGDQMVSVGTFSPSKIGKLDKNAKKVKGKRKRATHGFGRYIRKYAVVFAVGLGIVGAGLVLGWTVGWMLI